jgi:N-dimethylarginine dimethylaminohydrolase
LIRLMTENVPNLILMCSPEHFEVSYAINPWMKPDEWSAHREDLEARAKAGWKALVAEYEKCGRKVKFVEPVKGLPDMVFTANAAVVLNRIALVARFRYEQRVGETPVFTEYFESLVKEGIIDKVVQLPEDVTLEGNGDCVWDPTHNCFYMGCGPRSDPRAQEIVKNTFGVEVHRFELINPKFYHMDTALCPLSGGEALVVRSAFSPEDIARLQKIIGEDKVIFVPEEDADRFCANAVNLGREIVLCKCSDAMSSLLESRGYNLHKIAVDPFQLSGGSVWCLTLALDRFSRK